MDANRGSEIGGDGGGGNREEHKKNVFFYFYSDDENGTKRKEMKTLLYKKETKSFMRIRWWRLAGHNTIISMKRFVFFPPSVPIKEIDLTWRRVKNETNDRRKMTTIHVQYFSSRICGMCVCVYQYYIYLIIPDDQEMFAFAYIQRWYH